MTEIMIFKLQHMSWEETTFTHQYSHVRIFMKSCELIIHSGKEHFHLLQS